MIFYDFYYGILVERIFLWFLWFFTCHICGNGFCSFLFQSLMVFMVFMIFMILNFLFMALEPCNCNQQLSEVRINFLFWFYWFWHHLQNRIEVTWRHFIDCWIFRGYLERDENWMRSWSGKLEIETEQF